MKTIDRTTAKRNRKRIVKILAVAILTILSTGVWAEEFKKFYDGRYSVEKGAVMTIQNKFGKVNCQVWDESSVSVKVTVTVESSSQEKADKVFEKISIELKGNRSAVSGVSKVGNVSKAEYSIDYDIRMPRWINIEIDNNFGDVFLDEMDGTVKLNLEYGALEAFNMNSNNNVLTIKFGKARTGFINDAKIDIEYSELKTAGAGNLEIVSRFSELTLEKTGTLKLDSQYDNVKAESLDGIISVSRFTDFSINKLNGDFDFDIQYGELAVGHIAPGFTKGNIRNSFAGAKLVFDPKTSFNLNAEMSFGDLNYPKANASIDKETVGYTTNRYMGKIGTASSPMASLTIKSKYANTSISFQK